MASDKGIASPGKQASDLKDPADVAQSMSGMLADTFLYHGEHVGDSIMSISRSTAKGLKEADQNIVNRLPENPVHIVWMLLALLRFATLLAEYWASAVGSIVTVMLYGNILVMPGVVCLVMCFYWLPGIAFFDKGLGFSTVVYAALVAADIVVGSVSQAMLCLLEGADLASQKYLMNKYGLGVATVASLVFQMLGHLLQIYLHLAHLFPTSIVRNAMALDNHSSAVMHAVRFRMRHHPKQDAASSSSK